MTHPDRPALLPFRDRDEAGELLGAALAARLAADAVPVADAVVLGVPRGGVIVAAAAARVAGTRLDIIVAHKVTAAWNPEFAVGAVTADGTTVIEPWARRATGLDDAALAERAAAESSRRGRARRACAPAGRGSRSPGSSRSSWTTASPPARRSMRPASRHGGWARHG